MEQVELVTGTVEPSTRGPYVEQVGWGVARQVSRRLADVVGEVPLLAEVPDLAERPGHVAYAVLEGREAVALALVRLEAEVATYVGEVVSDATPPATGDALLVRALHDAARAGAERLRVPASRPGLGRFAQVHGR